VDLEDEVVDELILHAPEGALGVLLLDLDGTGDTLDCLELTRPRSKVPGKAEGAVEETEVWLECMPPQALPMRSTARLAKPAAGEKLLVMLIAVFLNDG
jgi:hypothetical protein